MAACEQNPREWSFPQWGPMPSYVTQYSAIRIYSGTNTVVVTYQGIAEWLLRQNLGIDFWSIQIDDRHVEIHLSGIFTSHQLKQALSLLSLMYYP